MKLKPRKMKYLIVLPMITLLSLVKAQEKPGPEEAAVAAAVEQLRLNLINPDADALDKLTDDKLTYGHSGGKIEDKKTFIETLTSGASDFLKVSFENQSIAIEGNTAIVRHNLVADTHDTGQPAASIKLHILTVWVKDGNSWKMLARQAVKI